MNVAPARTPYIYLEKDISWHSVSCVCPACLLGDLHVGYMEPFRRVTFSKKKRPAMAFTGREVMP